MAVSVVLLVIGTFMYRRFQWQLGTGPGYRTDHLLMMSLDPTLVRYGEPQAMQFFDQVAERARSVPGVRAVALGSSVPMDNEFFVITIVPEGFQFPIGKESGTLLGSVVSEGYFETMGLSILRGRSFRATDSADAPKVAVINEQVAQKLRAKLPQRQRQALRALLPLAPAWMRPTIHTIVATPSRG